MAYFIVHLSFRDPSKVWDQVPEHSRWLRSHHAAGKIVTGGPLKDMSGAIGILSVDSRSEAEKILEDEPLMKHGIATMSLMEWQPLVSGNINKK